MRVSASRRRRKAVGKREVVGWEVGWLDGWEVGSDIVELFIISTIAFGNIAKHRYGGPTHLTD
jgi:hypothetical protein